MPQYRKFNRFDHTKQQEIYDKLYKPIQANKAIPLFITYQDILKFINKEHIDKEVLDQLRLDDDGYNYSNISYAEKNGQRKLFISEVYYILKCYETMEQVYKKDSNVQLVQLYVGSAPGKHILTFNKLFPQMKFILFDPRDHEHTVVASEHVFKKDDQKVFEAITKELITEFFDSEENVNMLIFKNFFKDGDAELMKNIIREYRQQNKSQNKNKKLFFTFNSDIRDTSVSDTDEALKAETILTDMLMQQKWVKTIQPDMFSLKFKTSPPGVGEEYDTLHYLFGELFIQPWTWPWSREMRLIGHIKSEDDLEDIEYISKDIFTNILLYNTHLRYHKCKKVILPIVQDKELNSQLLVPSRPAKVQHSKQLPVYCDCHDCQIENHIWSMYQKFDKQNNFSYEDLFQMMLDNLFYGPKQVAQDDRENVKYGKPKNK